MAQKEGRVSQVCWASRRARAFLAPLSISQGVSVAQVTHFFQLSSQADGRPGCFDWASVCSWSFPGIHLETTSKDGLLPQS